MTGESLPVSKIAMQGADSKGTANSPDHKVYSGTLIIRGQGLGLVTATGPRSALGKIGKSLAGIESEAPPLRKQISGVVAVFAAGGLILSLLAFLLTGLLRGAWLEGLLGGVALSMALLPEEFPVVLTVFLVMGAWRISKLGVLTRRASAIETLGAATVLCTDKTGTLTENRMAVTELRIGTRSVKTVDGGALEKDFQGLLHTALLASDPEPSDPMDRAFHAWAGQLGEGAAQPFSSLIKRYPLTSELLAVTHVWRSANGSCAAAKGAPEAIAWLCRLDESDWNAMRRAVEEMARCGMRVIGVATAPVTGRKLPSTPAELAFTFLGLVGLADPLRPGVKEAVKECQAAGIRVIMITGDHPATAASIGAQAGITHDGVMTGAELDALTDEALAERVKAVSIFARTRPDQKLRIVNALKTGGQVVAMTGDGVNDAPSLKAAHIGVAMGQRGTAVAREASAITLLDDNFTSIVATIRLGRRIYDNLRKAICFVTAAHVPIAGLTFMPLLFGLPLMLLPVHIAFIELIIDPVCSIGFEAEPEERGIMRRPPRASDEPLLPLSLIAWGLFQGVVALLVVGALFIIGLGQGLPIDEVRSLGFLELVVANFALILTNRSLRQPLLANLARPNRQLWLVLIANTVLLGLLFLVGETRDLFRFGPLHGHDVAIALGSGLALIIVLQLVRRLWQPVR